VVVGGGGEKLLKVDRLVNIVVVVLECEHHLPAVHLGPTICPYAGQRHQPEEREEAERRTAAQIAQVFSGVKWVGAQGWCVVGHLGFMGLC